MILIDNHDSFTYNIVQYLRELGQNPRVVSNDIPLAELERQSFSMLILSPGPGNPDEAGVCLPAIDRFHDKKKILGICLGLQCLAQYFGCRIVKDRQPTHGKTSSIQFRQDAPLFQGMTQNFKAMRYHSLMVARDSVADGLEITAETPDGVIMGLSHRRHACHGVQFHPESILTEYGRRLLENFIGL